MVEFQEIPIAASSLDDMGKSLLVRMDSRGEGNDGPGHRNEQAARS